MRFFGGFLMVVSGIWLALVDIAASVWLLGAHGIGWVIAAWALFVPLVVIPFLAGLGVAFVVGLGVFWLGAFIKEAT